MALSAEHLQKPFKRIAKATKTPKDLTAPEKVHKLRTSSRKVEAALDTFDLLPAKEQKRFFSALDKVRRVAGKVRDMDVLTGKLAGVSIKEDRDCHVRLLEHLGAERQRLADKLERVMAKERKSLRRGAKRCAEKLASMLKSTSAKGKRSEAQAKSHALALSSKLRHFGSLRRENLHTFRKQGKQLRYVLQMDDRSPEATVNSLREIQDLIGEWHDWEELADVAGKILEHGSQCELVRELQQHADAAYDRAIAATDAKSKRGVGRGLKKKRPSEPTVVREVVSLAA